MVVGYDLAVGAAATPFFTVVFGFAFAVGAMALPYTFEALVFARGKRFMFLQLGLALMKR